MLIPVRCFSCNKVVGNKWEPYKRHLNAGISSGEALDKLGLPRFCCRRMLLSHVEVIDDIISDMHVETMVNAKRKVQYKDDLENKNLKKIKI